MEQLRVQPAVSLVCRAWRWTTRCGRRRRSPRIGIGCWRATSPERSLTMSSRRRAGRRLLSAEHFTVDGTLLEAWAGQKSFKRKDQPSDPPGRSGQSDRQFPRRTALESDASVDDRSRQPVVQEGHGARSQAGLSRRSADGEPPRSGRRRVRRAGDRHRRTRRRDQPGREPAATPGHHRRRQRRTTRAASSTRCARSEATPHVAQKTKSRTLDRRTTRHPGYAISQRAAETDRRSLRLDEDGRRAAQAPSPRRRVG